MSKYEQLRTINVNEHTEKKNGLTYLSWAWAWDAFKQAHEDATYEVVKDANGLPYFESWAGVMVYTKVTANGTTHEMWLPVMDGANNAMKREAYTYTVWDKYKSKEIEKKVAAFDMFDVNKTIMRCLVKNLAMFGLGLYIYAGEDIPDIGQNEKKEHESKIDLAVTSAIDAYNAGDVKSAHDCIYIDLDNNEDRLEAWGRLKDMPPLRRAVKEYRTELLKPTQLQEAA